MKILIISHILPYPPKGGSLQRNFHLLKEGSKENEIYLLCFYQRLLIKDQRSFEEGKEQISKYCKYLKVFPIPAEKNKLFWYLLLFLNFFSFKPYSIWKFKSKEMLKEIKRQLKEDVFDLVQIDTIALAEYAKLAPLVPKILVHQNVESDLLLRRSKQEKNPLAKLYLFCQGRKLKRYEKKVCPQFDVNIAVSEIDKRRFEDYMPNAKFEVVENGTDVEYFKVEERKFSKSLIFAGGMAWYPNKDAMLYFCKEVMPVLKERIPDIEMNIVGRYPPKELQKMAKEDNSIKIHGYVEDVRPYLAEALIYVVPIRVGGGTRLKILDALACGKPVVSTLIGSEGIEVTHGENILIADTPEEFVVQIEKITKDENLRKKLSQGGRKLVEEKYSWEKIGQTLNNIYQSLKR